MSTLELDENRGKGPPDEGIVEEEKGKGEMGRNMVVKDIGEIDKEVGEQIKGEVEGKDTEGMQEEEMVQKTVMMKGKNGTQDNLKDTSQVTFHYIFGEYSVKKMHLLSLKEGWEGACPP